MKGCGALAMLGSVTAALALVCGCASTGAPAKASAKLKALPASSCGPLEYGGRGAPNVLIASDLPLQGASRRQMTAMNDAIRLVLRHNHWRADSVNVAFQACDDSTAHARKWDPRKCSRNARAYAQDSSVVAVLGTYNSACAAIIIPVLNRAPGGAVAMISPGNTYVCLTESVPGCSKTEPGRYYPTGARNYVRVVANDAFQGAAIAELAKAKRIRRLFILNDNEATGIGIAGNVRRAAQSLGVKVVGDEAWNPRAAGYTALFNKVKRSRADGVVLAGVIDANGGRLIRDKVAVLGPNAATARQGVVLIAPDGFTTQSTIDPAAGGASQAVGMYLTVADVPLDRLGAAGRRFVSQFKQVYAKKLGGKPVDPYAAYAAQAAQVALHAIAQGGTDRAAVVRAIFAYHVRHGILGTFSFNANGDPTRASGAVVAITVYRATPGTALGEVAATITPAQRTVDAANGGAARGDG